MVAPFIRGLGRLASGFDFPPPPMFRPRPRQAAQVAQFVEPMPDLPGIRRALPNPDPQDVNFISPSLTPPPPTFPPFRQSIPYAIEPPYSPVSVPSFEPRINPSKVASYPVERYVPLQPEQIKLVQDSIAADPIGTVAQSIEMMNGAQTSQQFGRSLEIASLSRLGIGTGDEAFVFNRMLDGAVRNNARRLGIPEEEVDVILYTNSRQLPSESVQESFTAAGTRQDWRAAQTQSEKFYSQNNKAVAKTKRVEELDAFDTTRNGVIYRALATGELTPPDAARLVNQVNYRRIRLLQENGILPKSIVNRTKAEGGNRGVDLIKSTTVIGTDARKAAVYKAAIQTSESSDEVSQVYVLMRSDIVSPAYLDELEAITDAKIATLANIEDVVATRRPVVGSSTIDEDAVASANRAQTELDAARFEADRPENRGDIVTVAKRDKDGNIIKDFEGKTITEQYEQFGGKKSTLIDRSLFTAPAPRSGVTATKIRLSPHGTGYVERTVYNAQNSDATIAVARDFESPGEILTANAARGRVGVQFDSRGKARTFYPAPGQPNPGRQTPIFQISHGDSNYVASVNNIVDELNKIYVLKGQPVTVNLAGNSLASLGDGTLQGARQAQLDANAFARKILDSIMDHPNRNFEVGLARSGGQHGYDTALIKAASDNGIPTGVRHPSGPYGGVMVADPIDEAAKPMFMKQKEYLRFANGDIGALIGNP